MKRSGVWKAILLLFAVFCICFVHPLSLVGDGNIRLYLHVGNTLELQAIGHMAGGYRCYIPTGEYFWLSAADCEVATGNTLYVEFPLFESPILHRNEVQ